MTKFVYQTNFTAADMHKLNADGKVVVGASEVKKPAKVVETPVVETPVVEEAVVVEELVVEDDETEADE